MKSLFSIVIISFIFVIFGAGQTKAGADIGLSVDKDGIREFHLAIGEHYNVPEKEIIVVRQKKIQDEELPVLYFLARKSGVDISVIIKLKSEGKSWMDITSHLGYSADIYYVQLSRPSGPPYGKAHGHYRHRDRNEWKKIRLSDAEIIDYVNLGFLSNHYSYSPDDIAGMRASGKNFIYINGDLKRNKKVKQKSETMKISEKPNKKGGKVKNPK